MRKWFIVAGVVVVAVVVGVVLVVRSGGQPSADANSDEQAVQTTQVQRTDLEETTPDDGTVGYATPYTIVEPAGTAPSALTQAQQQAASAEATLTADQQALDDTNASDAQGVTQAQQAMSAGQTTEATDTTTEEADEATLTAAGQKESADCQGNAAASSPSTGSSASSTGSSTPCASDAAASAADQKAVAADQQKVQADQAALQNDQQQLASAQQKSSQGADQAQAKVVSDQLAVSTADSSLQQAEGAETGYEQTSRYTALPAVGQVIGFGQSLWSVDGQAVPLLNGTITPWRAFQPGMSAGTDVAALNRALIDLGDSSGLTASPDYTSATGAGVERLQASLGMPQNGALPLGSVIFEPAPVRVTTVHPDAGAAVTGGGPVLDVTSTTPIINVALPVSQAYLVKVGDDVTVNLPDGTNADGTITAVGTVATSTSDDNGDSGDNSPSATINVTVSLSHASAAGSLDQAPVTVNITNASASQVLAVPTTALLALAGGGYAVEVVASDGTHHLVAVTTGLFDDQSGLVQVSGDLQAGDTVVEGT
jgi:hypothetical protein